MKNSTFEFFHLKKQTIGKCPEKNTGSFRNWKQILLKPSRNIYIYFFSCDFVYILVYVKTAKNSCHS